MKLNQIVRRVHYWLAPFVAVPLLVIFSTGLLLQTKKWFAWVQPTELRGGEPAVGLPQLLEIARADLRAGVQTWEDVSRIDVRPGRGLAKIITHARWEIQVDAQSGQVLQAADRRSDWIESLHDGSGFGAVVRWGLFVPTGILLFGLWGTGLYLFVLPIWVRRRNRVPPALVKPNS